MKLGKSRFDVMGQLASLRRYARSLTRDGGDAEDLVQDTLVKAYERRATFRPGANLRNWLLSILHNIHVDRVRASRSQSRRAEQAAVLADEAVEPGQDHAVRLGQIRKAFYSLPEEQREALHLVAIEGLSYEQAAAALGIPAGTLMSRISRARAALRAIEDGRPAARTHHLRIVGGGDDSSG